MSEPIVNDASTTLSLDEDIIDDLLYFARTNDLSELRTTLSSTAHSKKTNEASVIQKAIDVRSGNGMAHVASANGHLEILNYLSQLLAAVSPNLSNGHADILALPNASGSTPVHYAAITGQLECVKFLIKRTKTSEETKSLLEMKNAAGHDAAWEAESAGKDDCVTWLLGCLDELDGTNDGMETSNAVSDSTQTHPSGENGVESAETGVAELNLE